jgi:cyclomaltodextrinase
VWADKKYDPEVYNPDQSTHDPDVVKFNADLFNWYKKFIGLRNQYAAIKWGDYTTLAIDDAKKLYAFRRKYGKEEVVVIVNRGSKAVIFKNALLKNGEYKDVFTKKMVTEVTVHPMNVIVLTNHLAR